MSGIIEWPLPPVNLLKTWQKVGESINVEVINDTETVIMKVRMFGLGKNGSYLNWINPPSLPTCLPTCMSVLLVTLILTWTLFFVFPWRPPIRSHKLKGKKTCRVGIVFVKRDPKAHGGGAGKGKRLGEKEKKTNPNPPPLPSLFWRVCLSFGIIFWLPPTLGQLKVQSYRTAKFAALQANLKEDIQL